MGLFDKLKNVLFVEEEVEIPVITKKTEEEPKKMEREQRRSNVTFDTEEIDIPSSKDNISRFRNVKRDIEVSSVNDEAKTEEIPIPIEEQLQEKSSPFLSFDEDEFERLNSRIKDNEEKQEKEKKEIKEKQKPKKVEEPKRPEAPRRFKPSPVISPVYGILDKNYKKEDIVQKGIEQTTILEEVSVETVRKKAFGTLVDDIESTLGEEIPSIPREEVEDERSIDEILTESIDETISLDEEIGLPIINNESSRIEDLLEDEPLTEETTIDDEIEDSITSVQEEPILQEDEIELPSFEALNDEKIEEVKEESAEDEFLSKTNTIKMLDDIEDELDDVKVNKELLEDTTETDLFNLIDSMYENREEDK